MRMSCTLISQEEPEIFIMRTTTTAPNRNQELKGGGNCCSVGCFRLEQSIQNVHLAHYPSICLKDCYVMLFWWYLVTLVVSDRHINISHFHLEQNIGSREAASICLPASTLPWDSLGAEDKHICTANTTNEPSRINWEGVLWFYSATVSLAISTVSTTSSLLCLTLWNICVQFIPCACIKFAYSLGTASAQDD